MFRKLNFFVVKGVLFALLRSSDNGFEHHVEYSRYNRLNSCNS